MSYYFHPSVEAGHFEAIAFFESRHPILGAEYLAEIEELIASVVHAPHRCLIERKPNIRCIFFKRFLVNIIFRDIEGVVQILALAHKRRRPDLGLGRL